MSASTVLQPATHTQPRHCAHAWPLSFDALVRRSGFAYARAGSGKAIREAHGYKATSSGTRCQQGVSWSLLAKAFIPLANYPRTTAVPALTEAWVILRQDRLSDLTETELRTLRKELEARKVDLDRDIYHAREQGNPVRDLRARLADVVIELTAIDDLLENPERQ